MAAVDAAEPGSVLDRFVADLRALLADGVGEDPDRAVPLVEERMSQALHHDAFVLDCLEAALTGLRPVRGLVHREPGDLFTVNLFYWSPGLASPPHEHRNWTVTGVVMNSIEVRTFTAQAGKLVTERSFRGRARDVGSVRPPNIHRVRNPSRKNSVTLHVFGRSSQLPDTVWYRGDDIEPPAPAGRSPERPMLLRIEATVEAAERIGGPAAVAFLRRLLARMGHLGRPAVLAALARLGVDVDDELGPSPASDPASVPGRDGPPPQRPRIGRRPKGAEAQAIVERAGAFDLTEVVSRYQKDFGVDDETAGLHEVELKRYLTLAALYPDAPLGMNGKVDDLWHTFLLFTESYQRFCREVAGYFIHHRPTDEADVERSPEARAAAVGSVQRFVTLYGEVFDTLPPEDVWGYPSDIVWKCQKCGGWPNCDNTPPGRCTNCVNCQSPTSCQVEPICECPTCETPVCECPVCESADMAVRQR
jgi:predicted metal-dependent enzyme (double-stranded beta helix superfamily)